MADRPVTVRRARIGQVIGRLTEVDIRHYALPWHSSWVSRTDVDHSAMAQTQCSSSSVAARQIYPLVRPAILRPSGRPVWGTGIEFDIIR
jgi:hypothetical protein